MHLYISIKASASQGNPLDLHAFPVLVHTGLNYAYDFLIWCILFWIHA